MYEKPLPVIDPESQPYWDALKQHRLLLKHCRACQRFHHYPRELCPHCHSDALEWADGLGGWKALAARADANAAALNAWVDKTPWIHMDIAGVAWSRKDRSTTPKGASGFGVRALDRLVRDYVEKA